MLPHTADKVKRRDLALKVRSTGDTLRRIAVTVLGDSAAVSYRCRAMAVLA